MNKQHALVVYLMDVLALRSGLSPKVGGSENFGCGTLKPEHIQLRKDENKFFLTLDFLGKSSVPYRNTAKIQEVAFKCLEELIGQKQPDERVFELISRVTLQTYVNKLLPGTLPKHFRIFQAGSLLQDGLNRLEELNSERLILGYKHVLGSAAMMCNHKEKNQAPAKSVTRRFDGDFVLNYETTQSHYCDPRISVSW